MLGHSRWLMKGRPSPLRVLPDYLLARAREAFLSVFADASKRSLYRARRLHYTAMLASARQPGFAPLVLPDGQAEALP
jgi:hypothetical protein